MRYLRVLLYLIAADILSLFVGLTLAGSANPLIRVISALCGAGIMLCLMANLALKAAAVDLKDERRSGTKTSLLLPAGMTVTALTVPLASWLVLVNGWFIQLYNMIQPDASSAALTSGQIWAMLPLAFAPAAVFAVFYVLGYRGVICLEK